LGVLRYYLVYRAMVRAMVSTIRARQTGFAEAEKRDALAECGSYTTLAKSYTQLDQPALMITHGLSGSGKTYVAQALLEHYPAIRIRSDTERKRLRGLKAGARTRSDIDRGLYTVEATARTYDRLAELARAILQAGYTAIVDAAFLQHSQRDIFYRLATDLHLPFTILDCEAPQNVMQDRVSKREHEGCDASEANTAVLKQQIATREALSERETADAIVIDTVTTVDGANLTKTLRSRMRG
ncbi:MAG: AAA family ATPase, partial [Acidiferrobacterales bacterium]